MTGEVLAWLMPPTSGVLILALGLAGLLSALACGQEAGAGSKAVVTLAPPPKLTELEKGWSEAWVKAAIGEAEGVQVQCLAQGWGAMHWDENIEGQPLRLGGKAYALGLATHADSDIRVRLGRPGRRLRVLAGVDDNQRTALGEAAGVAFSVEVGGKALWSCPPRRASDGAIEVDVDLGGAEEFHLLARNPEGKIRYAHADWVNPVVTLEDGTEVELSRTEMGMGRPDGAAFSFRYGGQASADLLPGWQVSRSSQEEAGGVRVHQVVYSDPKTKLQCTLELRQYSDFPAAKWVVRFRNAGTSDTPVLEDIWALDAAWRCSAQGKLFYARGSDARIDDFLGGSAALPQRDVDQPLSFVSIGGRSSTAYLPFFHLDGGGDSPVGVMIGVGWSGQWAASVEQDFSGRIRVRAGMEKTHLVLHPGEEIRTPSILTIFRQGEKLRGHQLLRQFILHHNTPRDARGQVVVAPLSAANWGGQLSSAIVPDIKRIAAAKLPYDLYWVDAGWFGDTGGKFILETTGHWYTQAGNWRIDPSIHPNGLKDVAKAAREAGMGFMLWAEPERAVYGTPLPNEHPDWFLGKREPGRSLLLNLGEPAARQWATQFISGLVKDLGLTWYRQDFNMNCLDLWRANDAADRQGMTEIRHIEGLYAFWDELRRRHPGLMIDNCASGGRRLDLETLARSVPLWRTDYHCPGRDHDPIGGQVHTMGLSYWLPLSGGSAAAGAMDTYTFRSNFAPAMQYWGGVLGESGDAAIAQWCSTMLQQYRQARPFFYGDYYPLTEASAQADGWAAYQMHRPDLEQGMIVMLRRTQSPFSSAQLKLGGLEPAARYEFTDADSGQTISHTGQEALAGISWTLDTPRSSRLVFYHKAK